MFEPCGYSMNGIEGDAYHTIHITPESHCSYASFETNAPLDSYQQLIHRVISTFRPGRFTIMFFADENSPISKMSSHQLDDSNPRKEPYWRVPGYSNTCLCFHEFEPGYFIVLANYRKKGLPRSGSGVFANTSSPPTSPKNLAQ